MDSQPTCPPPPPLLAQSTQLIACNDRDTSGSPRQMQLLGGALSATKSEVLDGAGLLTVSAEGHSLASVIGSNFLPNGVSSVAFGSQMDQRLGYGTNTFAGTAAAGINSDGVEKSPQVQAIVNQINARLEAQEKAKIGLNVGAFTGPSIITGSTSPGSGASANGFLSNGMGYFSQSTQSQSAILSNMVTDNTSSGGVMPKIATMPHGELGNAAALGGMGSSLPYPDPAALAFRGLSHLSYIPGTSIAMAPSQRPTLTQCNTMQHNGLAASLSGLHRSNSMGYSHMAAAVAAANGAMAGGYYSSLQSSAAAHGVCNPMDTFGAMGMSGQSASLAAGYQGIPALSGGIPTSLAALQQSGLGFNRNPTTASTSLKRGYPDSGTSLVDKRTKLF